MKTKEEINHLAANDVEKKAKEEHEQALKRGGSEYAAGYYEGLLDGYNQAFEDNKEKKYTKEDLENAFNSGRGYGVPDNIKDFNSFINSLNKQD